jgi:hypothetical protein
MGNGYHDHDDDDGEEAGQQPDSFWRRRVITLGLGLGLLGILAWGFSGGGGKPAQSSPSASLPAATALGTAIPGLASSSPAAAASSMSPSPGASASAHGSASASARASGSPRPSASPAASASAASGGTIAGGHCAPGSVVLSLFSDRTRYGSGQFPQFQVYAVSTSGTSCWFDPRQLQVAVMASGRIVWDSSDCSPITGRPMELARGVPAEAAITWDRSITLPGCQVLAVDARPGDYTAQARTGTVQSPLRAFRITS